MSDVPRILAFAGSTRRESYNKRLLNIAVAAARDAGADVTLIDLAQFPLPLYDGDLEAEQGLPEHAVTIKELLLAHQGLLLACPEYNSSISAVLKNTIDWASRAREGEPALQCFKGKVVTLMSASPGRLGGLRGLMQVRAILHAVGCIVLPDQVAIAAAGGAFRDDGSLNEDAQQESVMRLGAGLAEFVGKLTSAPSAI